MLRMVPLPRFAREDVAERGAGGAIMRAPRETIDNARRLRRALSPPEARLWSRLRARVAGMPVFRRQHPIGPYVLDFYCAKARLAVEIDGMSHDLGDRPERDTRRDAWLEAQGLTVMRIAASELTRGIDEAADGIVRMALEMIEERASSAPSTMLRMVPLPRDAQGCPGKIHA
jgi:very-short-patch-repair endonuclease